MYWILPLSLGRCCGLAWFDTPLECKCGNPPCWMISVTCWVSGWACLSNCQGSAVLKKQQVYFRCLLKPKVLCRAGGLELALLLIHLQLILLWWPWGGTPRAVAVGVNALLGGIRENCWLQFVRTVFSRCSLYVQGDRFWWNVRGFSLLFCRFSSWLIFLWMHGWNLGEAWVTSQCSLIWCPYVHVSRVSKSITVTNASDTKYYCMLGKMSMTCVNQESMSLFHLFSLLTSNCLDQG